MRNRSRALVFLALAASLALVSRAWAAESAEALFPYSGLSHVQVSPEGRWISASATRGENALVLVQQVGRAATTILITADWVGQVAWDGPDTLLVETVSTTGQPFVLVARMKPAAERFEIAVRKIHAPGELVHALPFAGDTVLWAFRYKGWTSLHRVTIEDLLDFQDRHRTSARSIELGERLAGVNGPAARWIVDREGRPRAALRVDEDGYSVMMPARGTGPLEAVHRYAYDDTEGEANPVGLTEDGTRVIVTAYKGNDTRGLFIFDDRTGKVGEELFVHPEFDVDGILVDELTGDLVAATYHEDGEPRFHYFEEYRDRFLARLPEEWRSKPISILNGTVDRQVFAFSESSDTNPGDFYVRDRNGVVHRLGRRGENVDRERLSPVESFRVESSDGMQIEAYLTLPRRTSTSPPAPLIVMPHGGPFSIRDSRSYDPFVQYFASWGFAVLQVNYRGSVGYGRKFEQAVRKELARGIEDDIDAAVEYAMKLPTVDENRICIEGASYGGFSALASIVRHRERYRCAVSLNGVTDIPLLADSSDIADSKLALEHWESVVGDLDTDRKEILEISPAYNTKQIRTPVLIVHGTEDRRVDPDHAHRMLLMLELYGKEHAALEITGAAHGLDRDESIIYARAVRRFVTSHLMPEVPFRPDPRSALD